MYTKIGSPDPLSGLAATEACTGYCRTNAPVTLFLYTVHALWVLVTAAWPRKFKEYSSCIYEETRKASLYLLQDLICYIKLDIQLYVKMFSSLFLYLYSSKILGVQCECIK